MGNTPDYLFGSEYECERLERQALLQPPECVLKHIPEGPGLRILDAGAGSGAVSRLIARTFPDTEIIGVDINPGYVDFARKRAATEGLSNLTFRQGDLSNLPFDDAQFDVVWSQFVLYFVPDTLQALREFRRVTKSGGKVICRTHDDIYSHSYPADTYLQQRIATLINAATHDWQSAKLPWLFKQAGFVDIDMEVETDRIYTALGTIDAPRRRNVEELYRAALAKSAHLLGGREEATRFLDDLLTYLDRDDTSTVATVWTAKGSVAP